MYLLSKLLTTSLLFASIAGLWLTLSNYVGIPKVIASLIRGTFYINLTLIVIYLLILIWVF